MPIETIIIEPNKKNKQYFRDLWKFRELFLFLAWRDLTVRYKQTAIGISWALLRPLLTILALCLVRWLFNKNQTQNTPIALEIASATLAWQFFASSFSDSANALVSNSNLVSKVYFPRLIVPASAIIVSLVDFCISLLILFGLMVYYSFLPGIQVLLFPLFLLLAAITALGSGLFFGALNVKFRDFRIVIPFIIQFGMYISPVIFTSQEIYSHPDIPQYLKTLYSLNPMVSVIDGFHWCFYGGNPPLSSSSFLISLTVSFVLFIAGLITFRKIEGEFADII